MLKINRKGFTLVEVIIASVMALLVAYFLIEITIKMVNKNNDYYIESELLADKNVITKEIMDDINDPELKLIKVVQNIDNDNNPVYNKFTLHFEDASGNPIEKLFEVTKEDNSLVVTYGNYKRKLSKYAVADNGLYISTKCTNGSFDTKNNCPDANNKANVVVELPSYTNFSASNFGININIPYDTEKVEIVIPKPRVTSDACGANAPVLTDNLIPVYYNESEGTWQTADYNNKDNQWFNYCEKKWANAVLVTKTKRDSLKDEDKDGKYNPNQVIGDSEAEGVLAFYVWIPRYKYKVWNIDKVPGTTSYGNYNPMTNGIEIEFETRGYSTGQINCNEYNYNTTEGSGLSETCSGSNGQYYTHPAFTNGEDNLYGFWMAKYESSGKKNTDTISKITILPNMPSLGGASDDPDDAEFYNSEIYDMYMSIKNMQKRDNIYGLNYEAKIDSHMINNLEWGAVAYLSHSEYGNCTNNYCKEIGYNNSINLYASTAYTGMSGGAAAGSITNKLDGSYEYNQIIKKVDTNSGKKVELVPALMYDKSTCELSNNSTVANCKTSFTSDDINGKTLYNGGFTLSFKVDNVAYLTFDYQEVHENEILGTKSFVAKLDESDNKYKYVIPESGINTNKNQKTINYWLDVGKEDYPLYNEYSDSPNEVNSIWYKLEPGEYFWRIKQDTGTPYNLYVKNLQVIENAVLFEEHVGEMASTNGNVTGVYDMSGGFYEYIWSNMSSRNDSFDYSSINTLYNSNGTHNKEKEKEFLKQESKFMTKYSNGTSTNDEKALKRSRLGDATVEVSYLKPMDNLSGLPTSRESGYRGFFNDSIFMPASYEVTIIDIVSQQATGTKIMNDTIFARGGSNSSSVDFNGNNVNELNGIFSSAVLEDHYYYSSIKPNLIVGSRAVLTVYSSN